MRKTIAIAHQKGGVGKSTLAANLAVYLDAAAIDLDYQQSVSLFSQSREEAGLKPIKIVKIKNRLELDKALIGNGLIVIDCGGFDSDINR
jgi:chromosome partitioning protein